MTFSEASNEIHVLQERLRNTQCFTHIGSWELRISDDLLTWSDATCRIFGVSSDNFPRNFGGFLAFVHPDDRNSLLTLHHKALHDETPINLEYRIVQPDGNVRYVHARAYVVTDAAGHRLLSGTVQDITETKKIRKSLSNKNLCYTWRPEWPISVDGKSSYPTDT